MHGFGPRESILRHVYVRFLWSSVIFLISIVLSKHWLKDPEKWFPRLIEHVISSKRLSGGGSPFLYARGSHTLKEEQKLKVLVKEEFGWIYCLESDDINWEWRKLHSKVFTEFTFDPILPWRYHQGVKVVRNKKSVRNLSTGFCYAKRIIKIVPG